MMLKTALNVTKSSQKHCSVLLSLFPPPFSTQVDSFIHFFPLAIEFPLFLSFPFRYFQAFCLTNTINFHWPVFSLFFLFSLHNLSLFSNFFTVTFSPFYCFPFLYIVSLVPSPLSRLCFSLRSFGHIFSFPIIQFRFFFISNSFEPVFFGAFLGFLNLFPNKPLFLLVCSTSLLKAL